MQRSTFVDPRTWVGALVWMVALAGVLWLVQAVNSVHRLTEFGLVPRSAEGLRGVLFQPFLHASNEHLASNTLPLVVIGWVVLLAGVRTWWLVTAIVVVGGGLLTWTIAPSGQVIVGASGVVFGWLGFLLARGAFSRDGRSVALSVIMLAVFGSLLFGLLPTVSAGVSWQAHLSGFVAGIVAAALLHNPRGGPGLLAPRRSVR